MVVFISVPWAGNGYGKTHDVTSRSHQRGILGLGLGLGLGLRLDVRLEAEGGVGTASLIYCRRSSYVYHLYTDDLLW